MTGMMARLVLLLVCSYWLAASAALAQSANVASASLAGNPTSQDPRAVDAYVPVITMEQVKAAHTLLQGYRVQIFKDGAVVYHGLADVKTLGEVRFYIKPEQVGGILDLIKKYKFWEVPEEQFGDRRTFEPVKRIFTIRDGSKVKTVRFASQNLGVALKKVVEDEVATAKLRCPYVPHDRTIDLCAAEEDYARYAIPEFFKVDLPRLMETYK